MTAWHSPGVLASTLALTCLQSELSSHFQSRARVSWFSHQGSVTMSEQPQRPRQPKIILSSAAKCVCLPLLRNHFFSKLANNQSLQSSYTGLEMLQGALNKVSSFQNKCIFKSVCFVVLFIKIRPITNFDPSPHCLLHGSLLS